jgi:hypothetical protein
MKIRSPLVGHQLQETVEFHGAYERVILPYKCLPDKRPDARAAIPQRVGFGLGRCWF